VTLAAIAQDDFAVGTLRGTAPDVQPGVGMSQILNGLINDDGDIYRRGGTTHLTAAPVNDAGNRPLFVWSGRLNAADVTVVVTSASIFHLLGDTPVFLAPGGIAYPTRAAVLGERLYLPNGWAVDNFAGMEVVAWTLPTNIPGTSTRVVEAVAGRLVVGAGNVIAFSNAIGPDLHALPVFSPTDYHVLPGGVVITGLKAIEDTLLVFTNFGLWSIANMAYDLTDAAGNVKHTLSLLAPELSLVNDAGLCGFETQIVAPCRDRVYLVSPGSAPLSVSDSITPLYMDLLAQGCLFGGAKAYRGTLFLPVLNVGSTVRTMLTCRLNRPVRGRYLYFPWTEFSGYAARHTCVDFSVTPSEAKLIGSHEDGHVNVLSGVFASGGADADGTIAPFQIESRDFPTGQGQPNHLRRIRLRYTNTAPASVVASYSADRAPFKTLAAKVLPAPGADPAAWWLATVQRSRYVRVRFLHTGSEPLTVHRIELGARTAAHAR
jgi:hypothetical protein